MRDRKIAQLNIKHFRKLLDAETDETKRQTLLQLLREEEAKLTALKGPSGDKQTG
jgi:hypothetical protein